MDADVQSDVVWVVGKLVESVLMSETFVGQSGRMVPQLVDESDSPVLARVTVAVVLSSVLQIAFALAGVCDHEHTSYTAASNAIAYAHALRDYFRETRDTDALALLERYAARRRAGPSTYPFPSVARESAHAMRRVYPYGLDTQVDALNELIQDTSHHIVADPHVVPPKLKARVTQRAASTCTPSIPDCPPPMH